MPRVPYFRMFQRKPITKMKDKELIRCTVCDITSDPHYSSNHSSALLFDSFNTFSKWVRTLQFVVDDHSGETICEECDRVIKETLQHYEDEDED